MTIDLERVLAGKRVLRRKLRELPIGEKLRLLDAMRERTLALRRATPAAGAVKEDRAPYRRSRPVGRSRRSRSP